MVRNDQQFLRAKDIEYDLTKRVREVMNQQPQGGAIAQTHEFGQFVFVKKAAAATSSGDDEEVGLVDKGTRGAESGQAAERDGYYIEIDNGAIAGEVAAALEDSVLYYDRSNLADVSGIFHRVIRGFRSQLPIFEYPTLDYRASVDIARWYLEREKLTFVDDVLEKRQLIKPGAVMFYGKPAKKYSKPDSSLIESRDIFHVGVVVSVEKDEAGNVVSYGLFHAQRMGKYARVTDWHKVDANDRFPDLGMGQAPWIAIAPLVSQ